MKARSIYKSIMYLLLALILLSIVKSAESQITDPVYSTVTIVVHVRRGALYVPLYELSRCSPHSVMSLIMEMGDEVEVQENMGRVIARVYSNQLSMLPIPSQPYGSAMIGCESVNWSVGS